MNSKNTFRTTTELINFLGIGRPTFYRRAKKLGIETNKHLADCKIKPNTLHKKTAETLMVID